MSAFSSNPINSLNLYGRKSLASKTGLVSECDTVKAAKENQKHEKNNGNIIQTMVNSKDSIDQSRNKEITHIIKYENKNEKILEFNFKVKSRYDDNVQKVRFVFNFKNHSCNLQATKKQSIISYVLTCI